jgi:hypothetical protein
MGPVRFAVARKNPAPEYDPGRSKFSILTESIFQKRTISSGISVKNSDVYKAKG